MIQGFQQESHGVRFATRRRTTSEMGRAATNLVWGESSFLAFTVVCIALHPGFVMKANEGGLSDYGVHLKTVVPYTLSLALLAVFNLRAAAVYANGDQRRRRLRRLLLTYSSVVLVVMFSTYVYSLNSELKNLHYALGTVLIIVVTVGSLWLFRLTPPSNLVRMFLVVQLTGDVLNVLTAFGKIHLLCAAEVLSNIGFAAILIRTGRKLAIEVESSSLSGP
jgi:hypothetical protein